MEKLAKFKNKTYKIIDKIKTGAIKIINENEDNIYQLKNVEKKIKESFRKALK